MVKIPYEEFRTALIHYCGDGDCANCKICETCCNRHGGLSQNIYNEDAAYRVVYPILFPNKTETVLTDVLSHFPDMPESTRRQILDAAIQCVCSDRETQYGSPEDSFNRIAKLWTAYHDIPYTAHDVAMMMALLKVARITEGRFKDDNYVDLAGYAACAAEIGGSK